jgi:two-component system, chemotaxis family, chemotaxis protein CheY
MSLASRRGEWILLIEDDADIRETIAEVLQGEGYSVVPTSNGAEGLACLGESKQPPALIILDLMMPIMDGAAFREEQQKRPEWEDIPVIVVSAARSSRTKAESMGARGYLQKPFAIDRLLDLVGEIQTEVRVLQ